jgi:hypothetical protein
MQGHRLPCFPNEKPGGARGDPALLLKSQAASEGALPPYREPTRHHRWPSLPIENQIGARGGIAFLQGNQAAPEAALPCLLLKNQAGLEVALPSD